VASFFLDHPVYICVCGCDNHLCFIVYREELITYYKQLSADADLRTAKAQWRIRRHQLRERRADLLLSESSWTPSTEVYCGFTVVGVSAHYTQIKPNSCFVGGAMSTGIVYGHRRTTNHILQFSTLEYLGRHCHVLVFVYVACRCCLLFLSTKKQLLFCKENT